jgi:hypothetical protein
MKPNGADEVEWARCQMEDYDAEKRKLPNRGINFIEGCSRVLGIMPIQE